MSKTSTKTGVWLGAIALGIVAVDHAWDETIRWWVVAALVIVVMWPALRAFGRGIGEGARASRPIVEDEPEPQPEPPVADSTPIRDEPVGGDRIEFLRDYAANPKMRTFYREDYLELLAEIDRLRERVKSNG